MVLKVQFTATIPELCTDQCLKRVTISPLLLHRHVPPYSKKYLETHFGRIKIGTELYL